MYKIQGSKYEATKTLTAKELMKLIRAETKAIIKDFERETGIKVKLSLRTDYFAGGWAVRSQVTDISINPITGYNDRGFPVLADSVQSLLKALEEAISSYNYDDSDSMTDYFNVRFYDGYVKLNWELQAKLEKELSK